MIFSESRAREISCLQQGKFRKLSSMRSLSRMYKTKFQSQRTWESKVPILYVGVIDVAVQLV